MRDSSEFHLNEQKDQKGLMPQIPNSPKTDQQPEPDPAAAPTKPETAEVVSGAPDATESSESVAPKPVKVAPRKRAQAQVASETPASVQRARPSTMAQPAEEDHPSASELAEDDDDTMSEPLVEKIRPAENEARSKKDKKGKKSKKSDDHKKKDKRGKKKSKKKDKSGKK